MTIRIGPAIMALCVSILIASTITTHGQITVPAGQSGEAPVIFNSSAAQG